MKLNVGSSLHVTQYSEVKSQLQIHFRTSLVIQATDKIFYHQAGVTTSLGIVISSKHQLSPAPDWINYIPIVRYLPIFIEKVYEKSEQITGYEGCSLMHNLPDSTLLFEFDL